MKERSMVSTVSAMGLLCVVSLLLCSWACSGSSSGEPDARPGDSAVDSAGTGGGPGLGGASGGGGAGSGGVFGLGGSQGSGGKSGAGGAGVGGVTGMGGAMGIDAGPGTGGATGVGGVTGIDGAAGMGGTSAGGATGAGGISSHGGAGSGGIPASGGMGAGGLAAGGTTGAGGSTSTGGATGMGGTTATGGDFGFTFRSPGSQTVSCTGSLGTLTITSPDMDWLCTFNQAGQKAVIYVRSTVTSANCVAMGAMPIYTTELAQVSVNGVVSSLAQAQYFYGDVHNNDYLTIDYQGATYKYYHSSIGYGNRKCQPMDCIDVYALDSTTLQTEGCSAARTLPEVCVQIKTGGTHASLVDTFAKCPGDVNP